MNGNGRFVAEERPVSFVWSWPNYLDYLDRLVGTDNDAPFN